MRWTVLALVAAMACKDSTSTDDTGPADDTGPSGEVDADGDGVTAADDCNDGDATIFPGADEVCDSVDQDCDDVIDEGASVTAWADGDGDGFGAGDGELACTLGTGQVGQGGDCDDGDAEVHPDATEVCDGVDNDCDGLTDDEDDSVDPDQGGGVWYADSDGDGQGDPETPIAACSQPEDAVDDQRDCDDSNADTYFGAPELCDGFDNDCDRIDDTVAYWPFDDGGGSVATDLGVNQHDGEIVGATWTTEGYSGDALIFNGGQFVNVNDPAFQLADAVTVSAWVAPDAMDNIRWNSIVGVGGLSNAMNPYWLGYHQWKLTFYTFDGTNPHDFLWDGVDHINELGQWHHVAATFDAGERALYFDGAEVGRDIALHTALGFDGAPLRIGADTDNGAPVLFFSGRIDEVKVFDCALDPTQVAADYNNNWPF
ncbi:MAG: hypothetical protein H6739_40265 [Alphaproteobacteria bacterium]|nr:hypothetical protein [Alphaproteobacteria bacterium]